MPLPPWFGQPSANPAPTPSQNSTLTGAPAMDPLAAAAASGPLAGANPGGPMLPFSPAPDPLAGLGSASASMSGSAPSNILQLTGQQAASGGTGAKILNPYGTSDPSVNPLIQAYQGSTSAYAPLPGGQQFGPGYLNAVQSVLGELVQGFANYAQNVQDPSVVSAQPTPQDLSAAYKNVMGLLDWGWANFPEFQQGTSAGMTGAASPPGMPSASSMGPGPTSVGFNGYPASPGSAQGRPSVMY